VILHVDVDPGIPPRSLANEGDVMKTLTYAVAMLAVIAAAAAPAMAQADAAYNAYGQPNQVYGVPGSGQASASSHPAP
jgi:uncharacterized membrane protein